MSSRVCLPPYLRRLLDRTYGLIFVHRTLWPLGSEFLHCATRTLTSFVRHPTDPQRMSISPAPSAGNNTPGRFLPFTPARTPSSSSTTIGSGREKVLYSSSQAAYPCREVRERGVRVYPCCSSTFDPPMFRQHGRACVLPPHNTPRACAHNSLCRCKWDRRAKPRRIR